MSEQWMQVITILVTNVAIMLTFFGIFISLHNSLREDIRCVNNRLNTPNEARSIKWKNKK